MAAPLILLSLNELSAGEQSLIRKVGLTHALQTAVHRTASTLGSVSAEMQDIDEMVDAHVMQNTPSLISIGKRCYTFTWPAGELPVLQGPGGKEIVLDVLHNVPYLPASRCNFSRSGRILGGIGGILGGIHWRAALAGYWAGSTGQLLWRDTRRDPPASSSGYWAGSTGEQLWRDTRQDPLASCSGGILSGIDWRAALAGYWVGAWCRSIANADSNIKSNNPFLLGGEKNKKASAAAETAAHRAGSPRSNL